MSDNVLVEREGDIATAVLNRPDRLNALNKAMWAELGETMRRLDGEEDVRCVVVRGAGDKAFAAGADVAELAVERTTMEQARDYGDLMSAAMVAIRDCRHPTVAMIRGPAMGAGLVVAILCDLRICGTSSRFGAPVNRLGASMPYPEIKALYELVGRATTLEILLEGRALTAEEALYKGLVTRMVEDDAVADEAYAAARRISDGAPLVNRAHKRFLRRLADPAPFTAADLDDSYSAVLTEDYRIGLKAFLDKAKPRFVGR